MSTPHQSNAPGKVTKVRILKNLPNRLGEKLTKGGGLMTSAAIRAASENVESMRERCILAIPGEISALTDILFSKSQSRVTRDQLEALLEGADSILTLSGTFGCDLLDIATKKFCDLCNGMMDQSLDDIAPLKIHLEAMRLLSPGSTLTDDEAGASLLLQQLGRIHDHLNIRPIGAGQLSTGL